MIRIIYHDIRTYLVQLDFNTYRGSSCHQSSENNDIRIVFMIDQDSEDVLINVTNIIISEKVSFVIFNCVLIRKH